jgi:hypothetical protein
VKRKLSSSKKNRFFPFRRRRREEEELEKKIRKITRKNEIKKEQFGLSS